MDFRELNLAELDRNLTEEERAEWNAIYASFQSASVVTGNVIGVDLYEFDLPSESSEIEKVQRKKMRCLIVIKYRVKIIIPETEVFDKNVSSGYHVLHSMCGADIEYVITHIDREAGFAIASRKMALERARNAAVGRRIREDSKITVKILSVGRNTCTVSYNGYDMVLHQRDICYSPVSDLREILRPGETRKAIVKEYDRGANVLKVSIKEATPHPFDGVETRHPLKSTRIGTIIGKYKGGVYCKLHDGITNVLCSYLSMEYDGDYNIGDSVEIVIKKYSYEKKMVYGKIIRKINTHN